MPQKLRDLVVKTGTYTVNGEEKARWQNIGALMKSDDGGEFVILHRWFNPAGIPNPDNRDSLLVSCFKPDQNGQGGQQRQAPPQQQPQQQPPQQQNGWDQGMDSEIPF
ncbi:hypothetical protein [Halomonas sp. IOP_31]|uniref:hypothetical protein n=1 Tax=Halomonas sp. IOP_31 TaxID=2876584 RepID=UPI001E39FDB2|nr:hypothetical protein [Halomonas sp. IOP_31]MCD6006861.1 hypothetical protein [Halomonas sp. IOP_31]